MYMNIDVCLLYECVLMHIHMNREKLAFNWTMKSHRGIYVDHEINVDQQIQPRKKCKYSILYLHLFRGFESWSTLTPRWNMAIAYTHYLF
jgi:hypothetical protein